jgi:hypothetical protein
MLKIKNYTPYNYVKDTLQTGLGNQRLNYPSIGKKTPHNS